MKRFACADDARSFVDLGCNVEVFTDAAILELETLGPLERVHPGAAAIHTETWDLFGGVDVPENDEEAYAVIARSINGARSSSPRNPG